MTMQSEQPIGVDVETLHIAVSDHLATAGTAVVHGTVTSWRPHKSGWIRAEIASLGANGVPTGKLAVGISPQCRVKPGIEVGSVVVVGGLMETHPIYTPLQLRAQHVHLLAATSPTNEELVAYLDHIFDTGRAFNNKQRVVPDPIQYIGLVTAASGGAGLNDPAAVLNQLPGVQVRTYPAPMMGPGSADRISEAIARASNENQIVLVCRGGGAATDLAPFNTTTAVDAILDSPVPVITGIGHATDNTAADTVAFHAADTPTAAAEWIAAQTKRAAQAALHAQLQAQQQAARVAQQQAQEQATHARQQLHQAQAHRTQARKVLAIAVVVIVIAMLIAAAALAAL